LYVLDAYGQPVPQGVSGELHIGGVGVARGYHGLPEMQAERFIDSPFVPGIGCTARAIWRATTIMANWNSSVATTSRSSCVACVWSREKSRRG
jgi:non-ribosomal peptide synthetase component F